ncbi:MAG: DnaJ domain-containing protein [Verrucomicrobiota bacterium]
MDYYETLGVNHTTQPDEIKKAYKKLASKHHPDKGGDEAEFKAAGTVVFHEEQLEVLRDNQVAITVVIKIDDQCTGTVVEPVGAALGRVIGKGSVGVLQEKAVGQSSLLAEV